MNTKIVVCFVLLLALVLVDGRRRKNRIYKNSRNPNIIPTLRWGDQPKRQCGYAGCPKPKPGMLNVHIVPHTHDDVGWLKTVDQYYYGSKGNIQKAGVQYILDSVVQSLLDDPEKRFIYVESAFFFKWWKEQTESLQTKVKQLVNEGRLEFIGGAWSMNDEATVHYQSTIDQFTWGLRKLNDTFGECGRPKVGWQIDPFGHSREQASLFAQMGYDGLFFGRLDYQDKKRRLAHREAEMVWHGSANLGDKADLFTGALYNNYSPPPGFCFDILCADEPIIDGYRSPDNNVERRVTEFIAYVVKMAESYRSENVILTMGEDFNYQDAQMWYKNLDKLIKYTNQKQANGSLINMFYSTPSCYLKALHDADLTWPSKSDDFFPYASDPHAYWTGYFTSRPTLKRFERIGNHFLQVCKQLTALAPNTNSRSFDYHLGFFREAMGIMQHHDAVTGTEKQHVADDYARHLTIAIRACGESARNALNQLTSADKSNLVSERWRYEDSHPTPKYDFEFNSCLGLNISQCDESEGSDNFIVTLFNPLAHSTFQYVRLPVTGGHYSVQDYRGVATDSQVVPIPESVRGLKFRLSNASFELVFLANEIPPLGYKSYYVTREGTLDPEVIMADQPVANEQNQPNVGSFQIGNKYINLTFGADGLLEGVESNGAQSKLTQTFFYYEGAWGDNRNFSDRSSGAYIFRPNSTEKILSDRALVQVVRGPLVEEVHQVFNDWLSQVVRVYSNENHAEFEWMVGGIPIEDGFGKEIVSRFSSDIASNGEFFTDSNGREMLRRIRNKRDTWNVEIAEKVAGNYYPVTTKIALEDEHNRLAVLNDRSQGGSSLKDGAVDLMIHRRLLHDDAFGVGEALNETAFGQGLVARGQHYLMFGSKSESSPSLQSQERFLQLKKLLPSWIFLSSATNHTYNDWQSKYRNIFSGLSLSLPQNVHLLTLEPWKDGTLLVRFEHLLEKTEDPALYSKSVTFNLADVMRGLNIVELRETTLAGNQWLNEATRFTFRESGDTYRGFDYTVPPTPAVPLTNPYTSEDVLQTVINLDRTNSDEAIPIRKDQHQLRTKLDYYADRAADPFVITLAPMQIRTFVLTLE